MHAGCFSTVQVDTDRKLLLMGFLAKVQRILGGDSVGHQTSLSKEVPAFGTVCSLASVDYLLTTTASPVSYLSIHSRS